MIHHYNFIEISFPKAVPPKEKPEFGPAPGQYKILESMGKQPISTKRNAPGVLMPKAPIKSTKPINDIEVGPGEYGAGPAAFEKQLQSTKRSCPQVKFGPGYRRNGNIQKPELFEPSPTPYSYQLPGSIATQLKGTPYRNAPGKSILRSITNYMLIFRHCSSFIEWKSQIRKSLVVALII